MPAHQRVKMTIGRQDSTVTHTTLGKFLKPGHQSMQTPSQMPCKSEPHFGSGDRLHDISRQHSNKAKQKVQPRNCHLQAYVCPRQRVSNRMNERPLMATCIKRPECNPIRKRSVSKYFVLRGKGPCSFHNDDMAQSFMLHANCLTNAFRGHWDLSRLGKEADFLHPATWFGCPVAL